MGSAREAVERWWVAFEAGDYATLETITTPDCDISMPGLGAIDRATLLGQVLPAYKTGFPDLRH